jgi:hypothetical protein
MASSLHMHEYLDHDHPEHRHGPATHEHPLIAGPDYHRDQGDDGDHASVELAPADDPGRHAVSVSSGVTQAQRFHVDMAIVHGLTTVEPDPPIWSALGPTDVRAHGPPSAAKSSPRAPPLSHLA